MKLTKIIFSLFIFSVIAGCENASEEAETSFPENSSTPLPITVIAPDSTKLPPTSTTTKAALNPAHGAPGHRCDIAVGAPLDSKPTQQTVNASPQQPVTVTPPPIQNVVPVAAAGVNPAHGQPGHRCDIAVGAPLNSKPNQQTVSANPQPVITPSSPKPPAPPLINLKPDEAAKAGMNPSHGQPGHRCDIAVGAPLNSKPTQ